MMWPSMPSFSWSLGIPPSLVSHWAPEQPLLQRHLLGSIHTPPLRQAGSHLAMITGRTRKQNSQEDKKGINVRSILLICKKTVSGLLSLCVAILTDMSIQKQHMDDDGADANVLKGTHQFGRRVPPSQGCSSTCQQECSVRSYSVWNKLSSAALEAPSDGGTLQGPEAWNSHKKEGNMSVCGGHVSVQSMQMNRESTLSHGVREALVFAVSV